MFTARAESHSLKADNRVSCGYVIFLSLVSQQKVMFAIKFVEPHVVEHRLVIEARLWANKVEQVNMFAFATCFWPIHCWRPPTIFA